jgi:hypothetical protein
LGKEITISFEIELGEVIVITRKRSRCEGWPIVTTISDNGRKKKHSFTIEHGDTVADKQNPPILLTNFLEGGNVPEYFQAFKYYSLNHNDKFSTSRSCRIDKMIF